jgi:hypothetical protein
MINKSVSFIIAIVVLPIVISGSAGAQPKGRLYELYNSSSVPAHYKRVLEHRIKRRELMGKVLSERALTAFKLGNVYAVPNPAVGVKHPVIHVEAGLADKVEIKIYSPAGKLIEEAVLTDPPALIKGVYAYEYKFLSNNTPYGTCNYTVKAYKSGKQPIEASGRMIFIRMGN